ncbi:putative ABC transport system permease protein [Tessaracoccus bendigoensis DSM 12906]|uniref:Putative ABC transport system permease protein n=1 Tax=Tessaracoccus bendigoensis DSM 12906 TaxID=1123357 RepID=A0A1M6NER0_9ACTN|nr:ABC transporter permease [Tessaracoccus bendigoensis]SHJ94104.1 putative ABC transport system permease protein [Tessaracoccus bendigoensis DSM 12906]
MSAPLARLRFNDLLREALAALISRPARSILTCLGTVLGVGTLVAILGLTSTAQSQISARFDALAATTVTIDDRHKTHPIFTPEAAQRVTTQINGVKAAGYYWPISGAPQMRARPTDPPVSRVELLASSPGLFNAIGAELASGTFYNDYHDSQQLPVALIGSIAAQRLDLPDMALRPSILINNRPYVVIGLIDQVEKLPELLNAVLIPPGTASARFEPPKTDGANAARMLISTRPGAAQQVALEAPWAISPQDLTQMAVAAPPDPRTLRESVDADLAGLLLTLAAICLFIGAVGIANTTLVAVMERVPEIGLRRSLGASRAHIFAQIVTESSLLGALGGLIGTTLGILAILAVSITQGWTPVLDPALALAAPVIGLLVGTIAGIQPSRQASRIQPTEALRR